MNDWLSQVRNEVGIPEDAFCYTALLKAAAREQNTAKTEALFDRAWHSGIQTAPIFNVLIGQHNELGHVKVNNLIPSLSTLQIPLRPSSIKVCIKEVLSLSLLKSRDGELKDSTYIARELYM